MMAVKHQRQFKNRMYIGPERGRYSVHDISESWWQSARGSLRIGVVVALKRAGSAFTITANDGGRAQEAVFEWEVYCPENGRFSVHDVSQ